MGMILADTNILVYIMNGLPQVNHYLDAEFALSEVSEIELLGVKGISKEEIKFRKNMINDCFLLNLNAAIKNTAIELKQKYTLKIPDALIAATAIQYDISLLSADKDFGRIKELDFILLAI